VVGEATDSKASVGGQADIDKLTTTAGLLAAGISPEATCGTRIHIRARLPIDGRLATGDGADRQGRLNGGRCVG